MLRSFMCQSTKFKIRILGFVSFLFTFHHLHTKYVHFTSAYLKIIPALLLGLEFYCWIPANI
jgi:hypothetical protein